MTKNSTKKIPRLRFKGFEGEWKEKKLGDIIDNFSYGLNAKANSYDGVNKYIRITDIDENTHKFKKENLTSPNINFHNKNNNEYLVKENDILFSRTGASTGKTYLYNKSDGIVYYAGFLIKGNVSNNNSPSFVFQNTLTNNYNKFVKVMSQRSGQPGINSNEYSKFKIYCPKLPEQQKIGSFFAKLDQLIDLQSKKVEQLKKLKRGYLQKMFPQKGESIPRLRFDGFSGEWERHILKDVISKIIDNRGKTPSHSSSGKYPIIEVNCLGNFQINYENISKYVNDFTYHNFFRSYLTKNDILFSTVGKIGIVSIMGDDKNAVIAQNIIGMRFKSNFYDPFVYYMFNQLDNFHKAKRIEMGAVQPSIKVSQLVKLSYLFPNLLEQKRIFFILNNIDRLINYENLKIKELIKLKKSYLQKMFC